MGIRNDECEGAFGGGMGVIIGERGGDIIAIMFVR